MSEAIVRLESDRLQRRGSCAGIIESCHRDEGRGIVEVAHNTYLQLVLGSGLFEVELQFEGVNISVYAGHSIDAALVENEAVVATMCVGGGVVDHRFVFIGHGDILVGKCPAGRLDAGLGCGGGSVGVEVVGVGEVGRTDDTGRGVDRERDVVDVVAAVVAGLPGS